MSDRRRLRIVPLGGLGEIGLNILLLEMIDHDSGEPEAAVAIDCGVMFPGIETPGIDLMIPDLTYVRSLGERLLGVLLTHGHEDHIGALPFLLRDSPVPVYGSAFTMGLVSAKLAEHGLRDKSKLHRFAARDKIVLGPFEIEPFHMTHSIVDASGFAIRTPAGIVIHTGDFKIDHTPVDGRVSDLERLAELGAEGVLLLLSDSTNAEKPGTTPSERSVAPGLERVFRDTPGKVLATTFASHIHRLQQLIEISYRTGRQVALLGRSLVENVKTAQELDRIDIPEEALVDLEVLKGLPPNQATVISTGSQGEARSALARVATGDHPHLSVAPGDAVVISARVIPGNERPITSVVNHLFRRGVQVYREENLEIHTSGHASQEELKLVLRLTRPRYFVPVHGEYRHLVKHRDLAVETGVPRGNCRILEDGDTLVLDEESAKPGAKVLAGRVFVDGKGVGDVEEVVLRDRRHLSQDGVVLAILGIHAASGDVVAGPDLVSRGFVLEGSNQQLLEEARTQVLNALSEISPESRSDTLEVQESVRRTLKRFFSKRLDRRPMILPFIMEM